MAIRERIALLPDLSAIVNEALVDHVVDLVKKGDEVVVLLCKPLLQEIEELAARDNPSGILALHHLEMLERESSTSDGQLMLQPVEFDNPGGTLSLPGTCREAARLEQAVLVTCDEIQETLARVEGVPVHRLEHHVSDEIERMFERFFDDDTMSIHLMEGQRPRGKKGRPGNWSLVDIDTEPLTREYLSAKVNEILNLTGTTGKHRGFLEIDYDGAKVVQMGPFRIAIAFPPVSKHVEITVTRPLVNLDLDYYHLPNDLVKRFLTEADGILISGPPGAGKSTFASALANFYSRHQKIVKTLESVRDLQVNPEIAQYGAIEGEMEKNADLLLLVRPDYTIFDEVRKTRDFEIFVDLRQAGVGMVGVVHASTPIDAVQRFIGRIDLGLLPQVVDTVIFVKDGNIEDIMGLRMVVKIPAGFRDEGLARPVIEVFSFFNKRQVLYEIYTFGENTIVVPVGQSRGNRSRGKHGSARMENSRGDRHAGMPAWDEGPGYYLEDDRGMPSGLGDELIPLEGVRTTKSSVELYLGREMANRVVSIHSPGGDLLLSGKVSGKGTIRLNRKGHEGRVLQDQLRRHGTLYFMVQD